MNPAYCEEGLRAYSWHKILSRLMCRQSNRIPLKTDLRPNEHNMLLYSFGSSFNIMSL